jgi:hypothetical protein
VGEPLKRSVLRFVSVMKVSLNQRKLFRHLFITIVLASTLACELDTRVSIVNDNNPPKFRLSGNGTLLTLFVYGPESSLNGFKKGVDEIKPIWKFVGGFPGVKIRDLPPIKYGETPVGFTQVEPKKGPPPPIAEGQYYMLTPVSGNPNWHAICFIVKGGKAEEVLCD